MRTFATLLSLLMAVTALGCTGDDGAQGPAGPAGPTGPAGPPGEAPTVDPTDTPVGVPEVIWSPAPIEDRSDATVQFVGDLRIVRDDLDQYFVEFDGYALPAGTYEIYQAVAGASIADQMANNDDSEKPRLLTEVSGQLPKYLRLDGAPPRATGGNQRFFDWIVIWDPSNNVNLVVADTDAFNDIPDGIPTVLWNPFELEDRRTDPATTGFGTAALVRDDRGTYYVMLSDDFVRPVDADLTLYAATGGADLDAQLASDTLDATEKPFEIGTISADGLQFVRLKAAPPRATGGETRFFDWILMDDGTDTVAVADFDAFNDEQ